MKLDKRHLIGSVFLLGSSVVYNVWIFTRPSVGSVNRTDVSSAEAPLLRDADGVAAPAAGAMQVPPLPDPELDRRPEWQRNPFASTRREQPSLIEHVAIEAAPPAAVADPRLTSILYSPSRRFAILDGHIVSIGETIQGSQVVDILPNAIVLDSGSRGRRVLELRPADTAIPARDVKRR